MVYYVGAVGRGRRAGSIVFGPEDLSWWLSVGGTKKDWDSHHAAGYVRKGGTWVYEGDEKCLPGKTSSGWNVAGTDYDDYDEMMEAVAACNTKTDEKKDQKGGGCCCPKKDTGTTPTPSGKNSVVTFSTGGSSTAGFGGVADGSHLAGSAQMKGMENQSTAEQRGAAAARALSGTVALPGGKTEAKPQAHPPDCCCCCCPCPPGYTYSRSSIVTSDPVLQYSGLSIQTGAAQIHSGARQKEQAYSSYPQKQMPGTMSVPGGGGPSTPTMAHSSIGKSQYPTTTSQPKKNCGQSGPCECGPCGCDEKSGKSESKSSENTPTIPLDKVEAGDAGGAGGCPGCGSPGGIPVGVIGGPAPHKVAPGGPRAPLASPDVRALAGAEKIAVPELERLPDLIVAPASMRGTRSLIGARSGDATAFADFSRDLLTDVLAVSGALVAASPVESTTLAASVVAASSVKKTREAVLRPGS